MCSDRIVILTGNHLCHNPRVVKEATTLANAGYDVNVAGAWFQKELKAQDVEILRSLPFNFHPVCDFTEDSPAWFRARAARKIGSLAHAFAAIENVHQLGYALPAM